MNITSPIAKITIDQFNYELPDERVAKYPLEKRDHSKLLVWKNETMVDEHFFNLPDLLPEKSLLVFNNTKVIRARLQFVKETGAQIEIFVLDPVEPADYAQNFQQTERCQWKCMVGNLKKWKSGSLTLIVDIGGEIIRLKANNLGELGNSRLVEFSWDKGNYTFAELLEAAGNIPIPPYLHRESEEIDLTRYQTVYSKIKGSVAAPTAGLHFTEQVFDALREKGISKAELTLHVGAGTFQPVKAETIDGHEMHTEHFLVYRSFIEQVCYQKNPLIAVGTTSIRTLESLYWMGLKAYIDPNVTFGELSVTQWEPYQQMVEISREQAFVSLLNYLDRNELECINSSTQIIIVPGYPFKVIDGMITNFHQPQSTLLLLISAFIGDDWKRVYQHALKNYYRFLSYGDSNLYLK